MQQEEIEEVMGEEVESEEEGESEEEENGVQEEEEWEVTYYVSVDQLYTQEENDVWMVEWRCSFCEWLCHPVTQQNKWCHLQEDHPARLAKFVQEHFRTTLSAMREEQVEIEEV